MSAWICSNKHISAILGAYAQSLDRFGTSPNRFSEETATEIGQLLLDENYRSVNHRYNENDRGKFRLAVATFRAPPDPVTALKLCLSLDYQSCETEDWDHTKAYYQLRQIQDAIIRKLPGYEAAAWSM